MANPASLKTQRTKLKNKLVEELIPQIADFTRRAAAYRQLDRDRLDELSMDIANFVDELQKKFDAINSYNQRIGTVYETAGDHAGLTNFEHARDADDDTMEQTSRGITSLTNHRRRIEARIQQLDAAEQQHENPQHVAEAVPNAAQIAEIVGQAVAAAVPDPAQMAVAIAQGFAQHNAAPNVDQVGADDENAPVVAAGPAVGGNVRPINVKLPKLEIPKFSGDLMQWTGFWEQFASTIHDIPVHVVPIIQKFNYLRTLVKGQAYDAIAGYPITIANYPLVVDVLQARFGKQDKIIAAHYDTLQKLPSTTNQTSKLRSFYDTLMRNIRALEALGENINNLGNVNLIRNKLPYDVLTRMEMKKVNDDAWTVPALHAALKQDLELRESLNQSEQISSGLFSDPDLSLKSSSGKPKTNSHDRTSPPKPHTTGEALVVTENRHKPTLPCIFCKKNGHFSDECTKYSTIPERQIQVKGLCFRCFSTEHMAGDCQNTRKCYHCSQRGKHNRALCPKKFGSTGPKPRGKNPESAGLVVEKTDGEGSGSEPNLIAYGESVLMQTALVKLKKVGQSTCFSVRIFFDCGANRSYITLELAKRLGLKFGAIVELSVVTFGSDKVHTVKGNTVILPIPLKDGTVFKITALAVPYITGKIHRTTYDKKFHSYLMKHFDMADSFPQQNETLTVELLIGQDYYLDFILPEKIQKKPGLYLLNTELGWILSGRIEEKAPRSTDANLLVLTYTTQMKPESAVFVHPDPSMQVEPDMSDFWKLETIGVETPTEKFDEQSAVQQFNNTVKIVNDRIQVGWPWRDKNPDLPTNYALAFHRFRAVAKRLEANPELLMKYAAIIKEQVKLGIIEAVTSDMPEGSFKHYIPHHPVETPTKTTTKVRVVYDASAKSKKGNKSLNDCLYPGPILIHDLCGLSLRFRLLPLAVVADIEKAFLNVDLVMEDRDVTRFFWFKDATVPTLENNLQIFRFCRVPFGVTSSPFLLAAALNYLLDSYGSAIALQIKQDIYVDNVITGAQDVPSAVKLYEESQVMFKSVSFNLREWSSNSEEFLKQIPPEHRAERTIFKVLGVIWDTDTDCLTITGFDKEKFEYVATKREALQALASVYDPLGYFTPVTLLAKIFLRSLWLEKMDWDEKLSTEKLAAWNEVYQLLLAISSHPIPRFLGHSSTGGTTFQLHCFCDASAECYATTVYLCSVLNGECYVNLIFSKIRLSPATTLTIPRLELMAALIGKRSLDFVQKQLQLPIDAKILWSDSQCVLHWIRDVNDRTKSLSVFIGNRVAEIKTSTDITYRYVNTADNPADMASRGCSVEALNASYWWHGPTWLENDDTTWPTWDVPVTDPAALEAIELETRKSKVLYEVGLVVGEGPTDSEMITPFGIKQENYSSLLKLLHITVRCMRFIKTIDKRNKFKWPILHPISVKYVSAQEISAAKLLWDLALQKHWYGDVLTAIANGTKHTLSDQLGLRLDEFGLLRCYGRFQNADLTEAARKPKLLLGKDHFTKLIIGHFHEVGLHTGISQTLASIRLEYWIPQGRSRVRSVLLDCRICRRVMGGPYKLPAMAPWPKEKMSRSSAFSFTGVDYFGPLYVRDGDNVSKKVWICLFTCIAVCAVHLELINDMSTDQFLLCLRRFISYHGKPIQFISDNAPQFKLAKSVIEKAWSSIISDPDTQSYVANQGITWKFIIELSPWTGGFYERMVGLVKCSLRKAIGKVCLTTCQLTTLLTEVQAVVNSRPLSYVGDDLNSDITLTPAHFLGLNPQIGVPELVDSDDGNDPEFIDPTTLSSAQKLLSLWKKGQKHLNQFWKIWNDNYLLSLRERTQHHVVQGRIRSPNTPQPGDVVLIKDNLPRGSWRIGKIESLFSNRDGLQRAAVIMLPSRKTVNRSVSLLYPIECPTVPTVPILADDTLQPPAVPPDLPTTVDLTVGNNDTVPAVISRPRRLAAVQARENIRRCVKDMVGLQFSPRPHKIGTKPKLETTV